MIASSIPNDPFSARPVYAPFIEVEEKNGQIQVRQTPPPKKGMRAFLARRFSMFPFRLVCLDECGTFFWKQIDGTRTLGDIEMQLRRQYCMEPARSRDAVIIFTKMLMRRSLIALKLPQQPSALVKEDPS
jgi:hypothetical protein